MPTLTNATPKYRHHKASGKAVVTLGGVDHYLGPWQSKASKREYDRLTGEWLTAGRRAPAPASKATIVELCLAHRKFAEGYYRKNGQPTRTIKRVRLASRREITKIERVPERSSIVRTNVSATSLT